MWIITRDKLAETWNEDENEVGTASVDYDDRPLNKLPHRFKLYDDDGELYYEGRSDDDSDFGPLDDFGLPNAGCTEIRYYNRDKKAWEIL